MGWFNTLFIHSWGCSNIIFAEIGKFSLNCSPLLFTLIKGLFLTAIQTGGCNTSLIIGSNFDNNTTPLIQKQFCSFVIMQIFGCYFICFLPRLQHLIVRQECIVLHSCYSVKDSVAKIGKKCFSKQWVNEKPIVSNHNSVSAWWNVNLQVLNLGNSLSICFRY